MRMGKLRGGNWMRLKKLRISLLAVLFLFAIGIRYYPIIDDHFLFFTPNNDFTFRPMAKLFDKAVWALQLNINLYIVKIILFALLAYSLYLFCKLLKKTGIELSVFFVVFILYFPLNVEAIYWMAAASRIILAFLFMVLAGLFLDKKKLILSGIFLLLVALTYETFYPVAVVFCLYLIFAEEKRNYKAIWVLVASAIVYLIFYLLVRNVSGEITSRGELVAWSDVIRHTKYALGEIRYLLQDITLKTFDFSTMLYYLPFFIALYLVFYKEREINIKKTLLLSVLIFISGFALCFVIAWVRAAERIAFAPLIGVAIFLDALLYWMFGVVKNKNIKKMAYVAIVALISSGFVSSTVPRLKQYEEAGKIDQKNANQVIEMCDIEKKNIVFLGCDIYLSDSIKYYEDVKLSIESYAFTGSVRQTLNDKNVSKNCAIQVKIGDEVDLLMLEDAEIYYLDSYYTLKKAELTEDNKVLVGEDIVGEIKEDAVYHVSTIK